jgi:hypothetical protein
VRLRTATESVGWINSVGPLTVSPNFNKQRAEAGSAPTMSQEDKVQPLTTHTVTAGTSNLTMATPMPNYRGSPEDLQARLDRAEAEGLALRAERDAYRQQLLEASFALDEVVAPDPDKPLAQRIRDEFADFSMVLDHCSEIYDRASGGRISKPNTLPREVIQEMEDLQTRQENEAIEEATAELVAENDALRTALQQKTEEWETRFPPSSWDTPLHKMLANVVDGLIREVRALLAAPRAAQLIESKGAARISE